MTTQKYLCPPRLQKKFLLWWWTVPELILIATLVVATFYLTSLELLALTLFVAIGAARVDFEHNLFGALRTRTLYHLFTKTFTANEKHAANKEEKRKRKRLVKQMRSRLPIQDLIQFRFTDGGIYGGRDGKELFRFYRYYPPNTDVMTDEEIAQEIEQLCRLFDSLRCPFTMFGTDKIEDMSALKEYYRSLPRRYDHILADVVNEIESTETKSSAVQRAYYFIYKAQSEEDDIYTLIVGKGYKIDRVKNDEMAVLLRNYLVREFINVDIYTIAEEVKNYPNMAKAKPAIYNKEIQRRLCPNRIDFTRDHAEQSGLMRRTLMIKNFPAQIPPRALYTVASMRGTSSSALSKLLKFVDAELEQLICTHDNDLDAERFIERPTAIFLIAPDENETRHFLASLFVRFLTDDLIALAERQGGHCPRPFYYFLDEFGNFPAIPGVTSLFSAIRSRGGRILVAVQSYSQFLLKYDKNVTEIIKDNCQILLNTFVSPSAQDTATSISKMLGDETILTGSSSRSDGKTTSSHQLMGRPLMSPAQMVRIQRDTWIVEKAGYTPMKTHLEGYWKYLSLAPQEQDSTGENDYLEIKLLSTESLRQALGSAPACPHTPPAATREPRRKLGASRREAAALYPGKFNP